MSGQSAALSLKESRAMQERVQCGGNHAQTNGGKKKKTPTGDSTFNKKQPHQG